MKSEFLLAPPPPNTARHNVTEVDSGQYSEELSHLGYVDLLVRAKELQRSGEINRALDFYKMARIVADTDEKKPVVDFNGLMEEAKIFEGSGEYDNAFDAYQLAEHVVDEKEFNKVGAVDYKMAEMRHKQADSGAFNKTTSLSMLDEADRLLTESDDNYAKARSRPFIEENKRAGQKAFEEAQYFYKMAESSEDDIKAVRIPQLNIAMKSLNESNEFYAMARDSKNDEYAPALTHLKKRHLGARAIMHFKKAIKSTLNRRS
jgi:hypothetical protein